MCWRSCDHDAFMASHRDAWRRLPLLLRTPLLIPPKSGHWSSTLRLCCHLSGGCKHFKCPGSNLVTPHLQKAYSLGDTSCCSSCFGARKGVWEKAGMLAQLVKFLLCKHKDQSLIPRTHIYFFKASVCNPSTREQTQGSQELTVQPICEAKLLCPGLALVSKIKVHAELRIDT